MPTTPRSRAQNEWYHLVLTVWRSEEHKRIGGDTLCAATGLLSSTGSVVRLDGREYHPRLDRSIKVSRMFSTVAQSVTVSLLWDRDSQSPVDFDLRYAVGELALVDERNGGSSIMDWRQRLRLVSGRVSSYRWGDDYETLELTLSGAQLLDRGDWYAPGAELSAERFPDIANTGDRDRARKSDGLLPPRVWAPVGTGVYVPALVIQDQVDAVPGVSSLGHFRYLLGYDRPAQVGADEQFRQRDPDRYRGEWLGSATSASYRATPASARDGLNEKYWYVEGDFVVTIGTTNVSFTNGSPTATIVHGRRQSREGWQIKGSTGGDDHYRVVLSRDGGSYELGNSAGIQQNYGGPTLSNGSGNGVPLPADSADGTFWLPATYGGPRGISQIVDVLLDWLRLCKFDIPIAYGDLEALRSRFAAWSLTYVRRTRGSPWAKILEVLEYAPIRPYVHDGVLRFRWVGPITDDDLVATVDLDSQSGVYRAEPLGWATGEPYPIVEVQSSWDIPEQKYQRTTVLDDRGGGPESALHVTCGRAQRAWAEWREVAGIRRSDQAPRLQRSYDTIEMAPGRELCPLWLLYRWGMVPHRMTVQVDATWRWLEPGYAIRLTQAGATWDESRWWVDGITIDGAGRGELLLEGVRP